MKNVSASGRSRKTDHAVGLALGIAYVVILVATASEIGFARDEGFYFRASRGYQKWFDVLGEDSSKALEEKTVGRHWSYNHEHPALMKIAFGFSERILHKKLDLMSPSTALRFPGMLSAGLCVYLLFLWGSFAFGRREGFFAAMAFALMPRVFYHAHLCCFDVAMTAVWFLVFYLYWRSLASWKFGLAAGVAFGFALCVKLNAFFLPAVMGLHFIVVYVRWRRAGGKSSGPAPKPWAFVYGLIFGPLIFMAHWPWVWFSTFKRIGRYMGFHSHHPFYNTAYFGENIVNAPTPVSYPFAMTLFTVPTVIILLFAAGSLLRARHHFPQRLERVVERFWKARGPLLVHGHDLLTFIGVLFPIALIALPGVPVFGGTKHWMPAMPFLALLAGVAAARLMDVASGVFVRIPAKVTGAVVLMVLLMAPLQQTVTSHPFGLASYVPLMGGARGAASAGMLRQFWGYTTAGVIPWLNRNVQKGGGVWYHDTARPSVSMFREEGMIRRDIRNQLKLKSAHYALVHHELHMIRNESWIWNLWKTITPEYVLTYQGVPIVSVYKKPVATPRRKLK